MARTEETLGSHGMKIARLCEESGLTRSTIHHYVNIGLLHRPRQVGLNLHLFDETHLNRLRQIRRLREKEGLPLAQIKELLDRVEPQEAAPSMPNAGTVHYTEVQSGNGRDERKEKDPGRKNREMILDAAIELFSERGYENTKISDITEALHMGKGTFYVYFKNKKELFMECIDRLTVTMVPREAWEGIRNEQDYYRKTRKRGVAFLNAFPGFRGILNLIRTALGGRDPVLAQKAKEAFRTLSSPMAKDLRRAISKGEVKPDTDVDLVAFLGLVLAEGIGYWQMMDPTCSIDRAMKTLADLFGTGLQQTGAGEDDPGGQGVRSGSLKDNRGVEVRLSNMLIGGHPYLVGSVGEGWVELEIANANRLEFSRRGASCLTTATLKDGGKVELDVEGETSLSGLAPFGSFRIPLKSIDHIHFDVSPHSLEERRHHGKEEE